MNRFTRPIGLGTAPFFVLTLTFVLGTASHVSATPTIVLITDTDTGPATRHGLVKLREALEDQGIAIRSDHASQTNEGIGRIVVGLASGKGPAAGLFRRTGAAFGGNPESLLVRHLESHSRPGLLVVGADDRGLMYALLDVAGQIRSAKDTDDLLTEIRDVVESPSVTDRALSIYTMHQACFEQRFYDESYWARYFDMLAASRFNRFVLIFGYENWGYFSPPYPYFFNLEEYPQVRVVGITPEKQRKNLVALDRMIEMAHARGLQFTVGIWDHIYRGGVQGPKDRADRPTEGIVWGLHQDNLVPYTKKALAEFLKRFPAIDSIQFRMHGESGLRRDEMEDFWTDVYRIMKAHRPEMRFDARAKNFPDSLIDRAIEIGVPIRICTKYWMEQMGMPFHPTHVHPGNQHDRRHGYADLLRYPKRYDVHWRLWNAGTTRVLLWGDPDYVRRFAESTHLYDGQGFEVNEMMGTKMQDHPHDLAPFELMPPEHRYYDWEFERYWYFYQTFGRIGYNPKTPNEVLRRGFDERFGPEAGATVQKALHRASQILPRAVAYCYPYRHFPTTRGWAARQRQGDLPDYARSLPSDTEQFLSMSEAARCVIEGEDSAKIWPDESAAWFDGAAQDVLQLAEQAEGRIGAGRNREFESTIVDLRILAHLAEYHAHRARAGFCWALFDRSQDVSALDRAVAQEEQAVAAWGRIVEAAGDFYHHDLMMGRRASGLSGHWRDELVKLREGLEKLKVQRRMYRPKVASTQPSIAHVPVHHASPGQPLEITATVTMIGDTGTVTLAYQTSGDDRHEIKMRPAGPGVFRAVIPAKQIVEDLAYSITAEDGEGRTSAWPRDRGQGLQPVVVTEDNQPPAVRHTPIATAAPSKPLTVRALVSDPSGVKWVRLRYRGVSQFFDYKTITMQQTAPGEFCATVPAADVEDQWDFMYFIECVDNAGNGTIYPDLEETAPYVIVRLEH